MTGRRILITGARGFVGRHVAAALAGRAQIVPAWLGERRANLLEPEDRAALVAAHPADTLIHLAWETTHGAFWHSDLNAAWAEASADLFARFLSAGGRRVVGVGTCAEYDWQGAREVYPEDAALAPHTAYGAAKAETAAALARAAEAAGASWAWARVFFAFGPGEPEARLVPSMLRAARTGTPLGIGPGSTVRDFWPVETLGRAIAALALSDVSGPVNTASGTGVRFADLAATVERIAGVSGTLRPDSRPLGAGEPARLVADATRLRAEVGFREAPALKTALRGYLAAL